MLKVSKNCTARKQQGNEIFLVLGKCRRKINIKRAGSELSQSAEFKSWLVSFIVRSPEKFICAEPDQQ